MYACAGGHEEVVRTLLDAGANVEDHNENGHTPLMEAASAGHVGVAKVCIPETNDLAALHGFWSSKCPSIATFIRFYIFRSSCRQGMRKKRD
jgi:hypothetical protein